MKQEKTAQLTIRIPTEMDNQLFALAKRNHITKTEQVRRLIQYGLSQKTISKMKPKYWYQQAKHLYRLESKQDYSQ